MTGVVSQSWSLYLNLYDDGALTTTQGSKGRKRRSTGLAENGKVDGVYATSAFLLLGAINPSFFAKGSLTRASGW